MTPSSDVTGIRGVVRHGDERGRELGFPTANVHEVDTVRSDGVYAARVTVGGMAHPAVVSVGHRPTYYGKEGMRLAEAHLIDWTGDLYDRFVSIELHLRLRPQRRFEDSLRLIAQIAEDIEQTRAWARANGYLHRPGRPRGRPFARGAPVAGAGRSRRMLERGHRRISAIRAAAASAPPGGLTHAWVAAATGLPEDYLRWHYPEPESMADL